MIGSIIWAWCQTNLRNSWMTSPKWTAQVAHFCFAAWLVLTVQLFWPWLLGWFVAIGLGVVAPLKEYLYDLHFEDPPQTLESQVIDHAVYTLGAVVGLLLLWQAGRLW